MPISFLVGAVREPPAAMMRLRRMFALIASLRVVLVVVTHEHET